ncbi:hypothetical protein A4R26_33010 [Niastella populi]|uniref:Glycosyl transferase family 1 domain-containing protein n=2 Tax=Niastella populi TaxID=550983 RepID=A0A1V9GAQ7_9BACT|nr:hypothetical protein A4R26_33010 [Niastella populi]
MTESRLENDNLPALFSHVINHLSEYNSRQQQQQRIEFAKQFLYKNQVSKIEQYLFDLKVK